MPTEKDLVHLSLFLACSHLSGTLASHIHTSPIIGFITIGALLGPPLADFVPIADGVMLAGLLGIQLYVIDAGLSTNLNDLKQTATRALFAAVLGVIFPIAGTILVLCMTDVIEGTFSTSTSLKSAFAAGSAIAPTSLGVTARLLADVNELDTPLGQLISVAAVFDDVISLVLLSQVVAIARDDPGVWKVVQPIVFSVIFISGAVVGALLFPHVIDFIYAKLRLPIHLHPIVGLWLLILVAIALTYVATLAKTSFLLAGYLVGVAFAQVPSHIAKTPWADHVVVHIQWLSMLFFAATIGFVIPIRDLFQPSSLGIGALLALVGVIGKLLSGLALLPNVIDGVAVGVAMLGRGEFGFLIASQARASGLVDERVYAATVWGVLVPTLLTPLVFGAIFEWRARRGARGGGSSESEKGDDEGSVQGE